MSVTELIEQVGDTLWDFFPESTPRAADRVRAIARARVIDEISRLPVSSPLSVTTVRDDLTPRVAADALVGLVGQPARALPGLRTTGVTLKLGVSCGGYLPLALSGTLAAIPTFPDTFAPLNFGDVSLHRPGIAISGRVVRRTLLSPPPLAGASVSLDAIWSNLPPANWTPPALAEPPRIVSVWPGLYSARPTNATVTEFTLAPTGSPKALTRTVSAGSLRLQLSDRKGVVPGGVLLIDQNAAQHTEAIRIASVEATLADDLPSWITLAYPCAMSHSYDSVCAAVTATAGANVAHSARAAIAADCVVFTEVLPPFTDGAYVQIDDGATPPEFQSVGIFAAKTDANGYFRLPPISRIALAGLLVKSAGLTDGHPILTLDYPSPTQQITVSLE